MEQAGLENMGCLFLGGPILLGIIGGILRYFGKAGRTPGYKRLIYLMVQFASGADRSADSVKQIQDILTYTFVHFHEYDELASAVASFVPGGSAPFHDEAWLAETFRAFLEKRGVLVPGQAGEWPPPPGLRA